MNNDILILHGSSQVIGTTYISPYYLYLALDPLGSFFICPCFKVEAPHLMSLFYELFGSIPAYVAQGTG
jgi:hypothetical protein